MPRDVTEFLRFGGGVVATLLAAQPVGAATGFRTTREEAGREEPQIPVCSRKFGTLSVSEPETKWWQSYDLGSPEAVLRIYVDKSGCFTIVEGDPGEDDTRREGTDYVLVPDLQASGGRAGAIDSRKKSAAVVLTVTGVRGGQVTTVEGRATRTDLGKLARDGAFDHALAAGGAKDYAGTDTGRLLALAYLQAYADLVTRFASLPVSAPTEPAP